MNYVFHPDAEAEHLESVAYYESKIPGLGASYLAEFEKVLTFICKYPERYPTERIFNVRRVQLQQFPYTIHYRKSSDVIQVLAVAHHRRRPQYWLARL